MVALPQRQAQLLAQPKQPTGRLIAQWLAALAAVVILVHLERLARQELVALTVKTALLARMGLQARLELVVKMALRARTGPRPHLPRQALVKQLARTARRAGLVAGRRLSGE